MAQPLATGAKTKTMTTTTTMTTEPLPLDKRRVARGAAGSSGSRAATAGAAEDSLPALHPDWKKPIQFVVYLPPPELNVRLMDPGKWEAWQVIGQWQLIGHVFSVYMDGLVAHRPRSP